MWLYDPVRLVKPDEKYVKLDSNYPETSLTENQLKHAKKQYEFAALYNKSNVYDLNYYLTTYVDLKYQDIWCDETLKKKKNEFKNNSVYFRLVK